MTLDCNLIARQFPAYILHRREAIVITMYSKSNCPNCEKLKTFFTTVGVEFRVEYIDNDFEAREFLLGHGHKSVPQVYNDGEHVGGYTDLSKLDTNQLSEKGLLDVSKQTH